MDRLPIPENYVRQLQIAHIAMGLSVIPMLALVVLLGEARVPSDADFHQIDLLSIIHIFVFVGSIVASGFLQSHLMRPAQENLLRSTSGDRISMWEQWLQGYKNAHIVSMAAREGAALFGLVVVLLASMNGTLAAKPLYWANLISMGLFLMHVGMNFPTEERIRAAAES